jgi:hypothetical protein
MATTVLRRKNTRLITLLGIIFMNIGALLMLLFLYFDYHEFHKISYWDHVEGEIVKVEVKEPEHNIEGDQRMNTKAHYPFFIDLEYNYMVNDILYSNTKVYAGNYARNHFKTIQDATLKEAYYKALSTITVYYNPENPGDSVLDPRMMINRRLLIGAFALIVLGIASSLIFIVQKPEKWSNPLTK